MLLYTTYHYFKCPLKVRGINGATLLKGAYSAPYMSTPNGVWYAIFSVSGKVLPTMLLYLLNYALLGIHMLLYLVEFNMYKCTSIGLDRVPNHTQHVEKSLFDNLKFPSKFVARVGAIPKLRNRIT